MIFYAAMMRRVRALCKQGVQRTTHDQSAFGGP
jgi:hypothetical protein